MQSIWHYRIVICKKDRLFLNLSFFMFLLLLLTVNIAGVNIALILLVMVLVVVLSGSEITLMKSENIDKDYYKRNEVREEPNNPNPEVSSEDLQDNKGIRPIMEEKKAAQETTDEAANTFDGYSEIIIK